MELSFFFNLGTFLLINKGALDNNIYLFISNSVENLKLNLYQDFQLILPMVFILWGILWTASSSECPIGYCVVYLWKSTLENIWKC